MPRWLFFVNTFTDLLNNLVDSTAKKAQCKDKIAASSLYAVVILQLNLSAYSKRENLALFLFLSLYAEAKITLSEIWWCPPALPLLMSLYSLHTTAILFQVLQFGWKFWLVKWKKHLQSGTAKVWDEKR